MGLESGVSFLLMVWKDAHDECQPIGLGTSHSYSLDIRDASEEAWFLIIILELKVIPSMPNLSSTRTSNLATVANPSGFHQPSGRHKKSGWGRSYIPALITVHSPGV